MRVVGLASLATAAAWTISKGEVGIAKSGDPGDRVPWSDVDGLHLSQTETLNVAFDLPDAPPAPHQAVLRLWNDNCEESYVAKVRGKKAKVVVPAKSLPDCLKDTVNAQVFVSSSTGRPASVEAFSFTVDGRTQPIPDSRVYRPLAAQPEIHHQFRPAPRTVSAVVATVFAGALVALLAVSGLGWSQTIKGFEPKALDFVLALVAFEAVFVGYFIEWSVFTALAAVAGLAPLLFFSGQRALRADKLAKTA